MRIKPILIVAGEPNSIFLEIFFKFIKKKIISNPVILIVSKDLFLKQMRQLGFNLKINLINEKRLIIKKLISSMLNTNLKMHLKKLQISQINT